MRFIYLILLTLLSMSCANSTPAPTPENELSKTRIQEALAFCKNNNMNQELILFLDMSFHSGRNRFMVYDARQQKVIHRFPVSHGCGNYPWSFTFTKNKPHFCNEDGSHCSSLGKYKIGARGYSNWGVNTKYMLHGLEAGNSNAFKRIIVLHSWEAVPDNDVYPDGTPEGWGCPAISNQNFKTLDPLLQQATSPVLLWMY
ncbi:MAG: peptidase [Chitinophagaceae bacterium]|nr:peptidase [Chitinophagaceae bacterium]